MVFHSRGSLPTSQGYSWHRLPDPSWANITGRFRAALLPVEATFWKMETEFYTQQICKEGPFRHLYSLNPLHGTYLVHQMSADSSNYKLKS